MIYMWRRIIVPKNIQSCIFISNILHNKVAVQIVENIKLALLNRRENDGYILSVEVNKYDIEAKNRDETDNMISNNMNEIKNINKHI